MKYFTWFRGGSRGLARWVALWGIMLLLTLWGASSRLYAAEHSEEENQIFDYAGLFGEKEVETLKERAGKIRDAMKAEVVILTVEDAEGESSQEISDQFYFRQGFDQHFDEDGILLLIDMDNRECYLGTYGYLIRVMTDERVQRVLDDVAPYLSSGEYASGALAGIEGVYQYFQKGISADQYNYDVETGKVEVYRSIRWYEAAFALVVSLIVAALACRGVVREYQMKDSSGVGSRLAYQVGCQFQFQNPSDELLNTVVTHTVIPRHTSSGGGRSLSSSGRSSTHSAGGHRAGGGGRKF